MLAKVIAHSDNRQAAIAKLAAGIRRMRLEGLGTNLGFLSDLLRSTPFVEARHHTGTIAQLYPDGWAPPAPPDLLRAVAVLVRFLCGQSVVASTPWQTLGSWRFTAPAGRCGQAVYYLEKQAAQVTATPYGWDVTLADESRYQFTAVSLEGGRISFEQAGQRQQMGVQVRGADVSVISDEGRFVITVETGEEAFLDNATATSATADEIRAPIPGLVVDVLHEPGAKLNKDEPVVILEAMKLMQTLAAPCDGILTECPCQPGETVAKNALLAAFKTEEHQE